MDNTNGIREVIDGYSQLKNPLKVKVRPMTLDEVKALTSGHVEFIANDGRLRTAKINGWVKRWKREPDRFELSLKYGIYEYATFTNSDLDRLVVRIVED